MPMLIPKVSGALDIAQDIPQDIPAIVPAPQVKKEPEGKYTKAYEASEISMSENPALEETGSKYAEAYRMALKTEIETKPIEESLPLAIDYVRVDNALNAPTGNFPDTKTARLARDAKVSINSARNNPEEAEQLADDRRNKRSLLTESVAKQIDANPDATAVLKQDLANFDKLYQILNYEEHTKGSIDDRFFDKLGNGWDSGVTGEMAEFSSEISDALSQGLPIPEAIRTQLEELTLTGQAGHRKSNWAGELLLSTTQVLPGLVASVKNSIVGGVSAGVLGGTVGSIVPGVGTAALGIPSAIIGAKIGFGTSTYKQTYVSAAYSYSQMKVDGEYLDPQVVDISATMEAVISTSLDFVGLGAFGLAAGGGKNAIKQIIKSGLNTPAGRKILTGLAKPGIKKTIKTTGKFAGAVAAEGVTEGMQEVVLDAFGELAKQWSSGLDGGEYEAKDILRPEVRDKAIDAMIEGAKASILLVGAPVVIPPMIQLGQKVIKHDAQMKAEESHDASLVEVIEIVKGMESKDTNPGRDAITDTLNQSGRGTSYLDPAGVKEAIESLNQSGVTAENTEWVSAIQAGLDKATKDGSSVEIPTIDMIHTLGEKGGEIFMDLISTDDNLTAPKGREEVNATLGEIINNEFELAAEHQEKMTELSKFTESTLTALKSTGVLSDNAAKMLSTLIPAWADTITQNTKLKPEELIKQFGLKIEGAYKGLEQKSMDGVRGSYNTKTKTINLGNDQDLTTFLHETAHFFLDIEQTIGDISRIEPIIPSMAKDLGVSESSIRDNFSNPETDPELYVQAHEYFAKKFESYIMQGKAPSNELGKEFRMWREWMNFTYKDGNALNMKLDDDSQAMFDNMLVAEQFSEQMRDELMYNDIQAQEIANEIGDANSSRRDKVKKESNEKNDIMKLFFKSLKRKQSKSYKKAKAEAKQEAADIVDKEPVYLFIDLIQEHDLKLDRKEIKKILGVKKLSSKILKVSMNDGYPISDISSTLDIFNDKSPANIIDMIINAPSKPERIKEVANGILNEKVIELSDTALMTQVVDAVRNKDVAKGLLSLLNKSLSENKQERVTNQSIKVSAIDAIYSMQVRDVITNPFHNREKKAAVRYLTAKNNGDMNNLQYYAKQRLLNFFMAKESAIIKTDFYKIRKELSKYKHQKVIRKLDIPGQDFVERISEKLAQAGILEESLANELPITPLKEMNVGEVYALNDTIKSIAKAAKTANNVLLGREQAKLDAVVGDIVSELKEFSPDTDLSAVVNDETNPSLVYARTFLSELTIIPWKLKTLTNPKGTSQSVTQMAIDRPLVLATQENYRLWQKRISPIIEEFKNSKDSFKEWMSSSHHIESLVGNEFIDKKASGKMTGENLLAFVLNIGTQKNLDKLLKGYDIIGKDDDATLDNPVVKEILSKLDKDQIAMVETIWRQMDSLFPDLADVAFRHKDVVLKREEVNEITLEGGKKLKGGYYPLFRDSDIEKGTNTEQTDTDALFAGEHGSLSFNPSSTFERTKAAYPVSLSINGRTMGHFREVIHYISHYDAVDSINKIIRHPDFRKQYQKAAGSVQLKGLDKWLAEVANDKAGKGNLSIDNALRRLRYGTTVAVLGMKATTALKQVLGVPVAMRELGEGSGWKGVARATKVLSMMRTNSGRPLIDDMLKSSAIMKSRIIHGDFDRDILELNESLEGSDSFKAKWNQAAMTPIRFVQSNFIDIPVWIAAREVSRDNALNNGKSDREASEISVSYADSLIERTQSSGTQKNLPAVLRKQRQEGTRSLFMFMTSMLSINNQATDAISSASRGSTSKADAANQLIWTFLAPSMMLTLVNSMLSDDEDFDLTSEAGSQLVNSIAGVIPLGDTLVSSIKGHPRLPGPLGSVTEGIGSAANLSANAYNIAFDDYESNPEKFRRDARKTLILLSTISGFGGGLQVGTTIDATIDSLENWDDLTSAEIAKALVSGAKK